MENFKAHSLTLEEQKKLSLTGILNVESFNEKEVSLKLADNMLSITGANLNVEKLNVEEGTLTIMGEIGAIRYSGVKESLMKRIFK